MLHDKTCLRCGLGEVDDEIHFLFNCLLHNDVRLKMLNMISKHCANFSQLDSKEKLIWLLNTENVDILLCMCNLIKTSKI